MSKNEAVECNCITKIHWWKIELRYWHRSCIYVPQSMKNWLFTAQSLLGLSLIRKKKIYIYNRQLTFLLFKFSNVRESLICDADMAFGKSCLLAKTSKMASFNSSSASWRTKKITIHYKKGKKRIKIKFKNG